ncbi:Transcription factor bHLH52 [Linum perenne]
MIPAPAPQILKFQQSAGSNEVKKKQSLLEQSMAARQRRRRRRISEKNQELGNLIPRGNKMNTVEMFQAAADYVKFQAATTVESLPTELGKLLGSDTIPRKLYSERLNINQRTSSDRS